MNDSRSPWHADDDLLAAYVLGERDGAGSRGPRAVLSASLEAHLLECGTCRTRLAEVSAMAGSDDREAAWSRLSDQVDQPSRRWFSRVLGGHRFFPSTVATPAMLLAAFTSVVLVAVVPLVTAVVAAEAAWTMIIALAPIAPMAAVALAYRDRSDPSGEISLATPAAGLPLVARRSLVVSALSLPLCLVVLLVVDRWIEPISLGLGFAWCLPGLALAGVVLFAGTTRVDPAVVAIALCLTWLTAVGLSVTSDRALQPEVLVEVLTNPVTQITALAVAGVTMLLTAVRRDAVAYRRLA